MYPAPLLSLVASRRSIRRQTIRALPRISQTRLLSQTASQPYAKKYDQDRTTIDTESSENTKSSTDSDVAAQDDAAYNPNKTSPESEMDSAQGRREGSGNPLEVSGANKDVSKQRDPKEEAEASPKKASSSGHGSPKKGKAKS